jgi:hypothetical protein
VIAGAGHDRAARAQRRGQIRVSDADREQIIHTLKAAYVYGLITKDEFDNRVSHTLSSRTRADLALVTADIPAGLAAAPPTLSPAPVKAEVGARTRATAKASPHMAFGERAVVLPAVLAGLALAIAAFAGGSVAGEVALGAAAECALLSLLFLAIAQIVNARRGKRPGGHSL